jgi:hypothetical protein
MLAGNQQSLVFSALFVNALIVAYAVLHGPGTHASAAALALCVLSLTTVSMYGVSRRRLVAPRATFFLAVISLTLSVWLLYILNR